MGSADGGKRGCTPLPSFAGNASAKLRRPRQNSPIPPRRLVCAAALPPSPYTKKRGALAAAARLKMSEKKPERAGKGAGLHVAREGVRSRYVSVFIILSIYIISYE